MKLHKITAYILSFVFAFGLGFGAMSFGGEGVFNDLTQVALADGDGPSQNVFDERNVDATVDENTEAGTFIEKLMGFINTFAAIVLAISILSILLAGLMYILSIGDPGKAEKAKMILIYSFVGIVVALSAFAIARLFASFGF